MINNTSLKAMKLFLKNFCTLAFITFAAGTLVACKPQQVEPLASAPAAAPSVIASGPIVAAPEVASSAAAAPVSEKVVAPTAPSTTPAATDAKLYTVVEGTKVDAKTMEGFRTWRAAACDRCHGANQEGMVGPSLVNSLKVLSKEEFVKTMKEGRLEKGMPSWSTNEQVMNNIDNLYAYLKGRSDGAITQARVSQIQ